MSPTELSTDSQAIVLLCSRLALPPKAAEASPPLTVGEWSALALKIAQSPWQRPHALFNRTAAELQEALGIGPPLAERVVHLLQRGGQLALELERLAGRGLWLLTRADAAYPAKLKERLKGRAPAVLCGAGPVELLNRPGLAVVGSREVDAGGAAFAETVGCRGALAELTVFSGAARGADLTAMRGALDCGGTAVGVLAESLERMVQSSALRRSIMAGRLALVTPYHPAAGFSAGNAMGRNKLIYALADYAVVVASGEQSGGTWAGALENLKAGWVPLFVRAGDGAPAPNQKLVEQGGLPLTLEELPQGPELRVWFEAQAAQWRETRKPEAKQLGFSLDAQQAQ